MKKAIHNSLKDIEEGYNTHSILYNADFAWPIIRLKVNEEIRKKEGLKSRTFKLNWFLFHKLLRSLFFGLSNLFRLRQFSFWIFSSSDRRKLINSKYVDRVAGSFAINYPKSLIIENPYPLGRHYKYKNLGNGKVLGQTVFFAATKIISLFLKKPRIENEEVLVKILAENHINLDYNKILKETRAQYFLMKFLLRFTKPKAVFFVYSASSMGYIKALKELNIPVIELQHGVINSSHHAYNLYRDFGYTLFPDYLLTYGPKELDVFNRSNYFIDPAHVFPVGYYFLEATSKFAITEEFEQQLRRQYKMIVAFSLQDPFETFTFEFLKKTAALNPSICYLLVPRKADKTFPDIERLENMYIERRMNIYECLKIADFHATINSTCAIESLFFGVPNVLYDFKNWASDYYGEILNDPGHTVFVSSPLEFIETLEQHRFYSKKVIGDKSESFIKRNFDENLKHLLDELVLTRVNE